MAVQMSSNLVTQVSEFLRAVRTLRSRVPAWILRKWGVREGGHDRRGPRPTPCQCSCK